MEENLPPGFRFHPTDEELITHYLSEKVSDLGFTSKVIADVDLNKCEPWDLPAKASMGEKEWYFFSLKDRKYPTGLRTNRATEAGYWKTTGKDKEIYRQVLLVGMKKTLVFYKGRAPKGEKTNWVMHEYRLQTNHSFRSSKDEWVVCRVFQKNVVIKRPQLTSSSLDQQSPDSQDETNTTISNEFGDIELPNPSLFSSCSTFDINHPDPLTNYTNIINSNLSLNSDLNMSNSNWLPPLSSWSSNLLSPALNSTVNSLLLKALQFRNMTDYSTYNQQVGIMPQFGANFTTSSNLTTSTSLPNYTVSSTSNNNNFDQQPTMRSEHVYDQPEQPFNWTPFIE